MLSFDAGTQSVHREVLQVLSIVIFAGGEGIQATSQPVNRGFNVDIIVIGENDVEAAIELGCCQLTEPSRHQG